jgi:hypothetical protein
MAPPDAERNLKQTRLLLSIGAEGGSIALYGDPSPGVERFRMVMVDQTPMFLDESEAGPTLRRDSGWLTGWPNALAALERYPWPNLVPLSIDPTIATLVSEALETYTERTGRPARETSLQRWRAACGGR